MLNVVREANHMKPQLLDNLNQWMKNYEGNRRFQKTVQCTFKKTSFNTFESLKICLRLGSK